MMGALFIIFGLFAVVFKLLTGMTVVAWANYKSRELVMVLRRVLLGEKVDWRRSPSRHSCKKA